MNFSYSIAADFVKYFGTLASSTSFHEYPIYLAVLFTKCTEAVKWPFWLSTICQKYIQLFRYRIHTTWEVNLLLFEGWEGETDLELLPPSRGGVIEGAGRQGCGDWSLLVLVVHVCPKSQPQKQAPMVGFICHCP